MKQRPFPTTVLTTSSSTTAVEHLRENTGELFATLSTEETGATFPAIIQLSSLDGRYGFKLDGEAVADYSGDSVSAAGDINGDGIDDLLIGAYGHNGYIGRSYVVFGGSTIGKSGLLALSTLKGANGFKLDGERSGDYSGSSLSAAGDMNGDGYLDLVIGAYQHNSDTGRSYVVFGGKNIGGSGLLPLSNLNGVNGFKLDGEIIGDKSGVPVRSAGDINNDGYADLLIGGFGHNDNTGRSYVVFGRKNINNGLFALSSLNGTNGFKLDGEEVDDYSGYSVSSAGDVNGDGYDDLLIGAGGYFNGSYIGRTYMVFGSGGIGSAGLLSLSSLNGTNGFKLDGEIIGDRSGWSVSGAGDVNKDGYADLLIGAQGYENGRGRSYLVLGGSTIGSNGLFTLSNLNGLNGFKFDGEASGDYSGFPVRSAGDINGDGYADLLIGAQGYHNNTGRTYVVFGGSQLTTSTDLFSLSSLDGVNGFKLEGEASGDFSGFSVSTAGDINGDGVDDLLIGAHGYQNNTGRSYVIFGDAPPVLVQNRLSVFQGETVVLNVNFLEAYDRNNANSSIIFIPAGVVHGQFEVSSQPGKAITNFTQPQLIAGNIRFVHDGSWQAPQYNITVYSAGIAWVGPIPATIVFTAKFHFPAVIQLSSLDGRYGFKLDGEYLGDRSGYHVSTAGDINDDGYADLLIGANGYNSNMGRSYVIFGEKNIGKSGLLSLSNLNGTNGFKLDGEKTQDYSGTAVSVIGDMNSDGYVDIIIGADAYSYSGRSYLVLGGKNISNNGLFALSNLNGANGFKIDGEASADYTYSGRSVSAGGDINGDGYVDLIIGAYRFNNYVGRNYVVFGGPTVGNNGWFSLSSLNGTNGFKLDGQTINDNSGFSVSTAGDINSDGYADLVIGAFGHNNMSGRSYVVFGNTTVGNNGLFALSSLNGVNGFILDGETDYDSNGYSVRGVGDLNDDGYVDLAIGALGHEMGIGRSYVIFGGKNVGGLGLLDLSILNGTKGFKLDGENAGDFSGYPVSAAGDINGDGYPDLLIGASGYNVNVGRTYVVFGGPGLATVADNGIFLLSSINGINGFSMDGEVSGDSSGYSADTAGDVNGDGVDDLLIGAYGYQNSTGRSYVVFGDAPPVIVNNRLNLHPGDTVVISSSHLKAYDRNHDNATLLFLPMNISHGRFETSIHPGIAIQNFTQQQISNRNIRFVHDGTEKAPAYNIIVRSAGIAWTGPESAEIIFTPRTGSLDVSVIVTVSVLSSVAALSAFLYCAYLYLRKKHIVRPQPPISLSDVKTQVSEPLNKVKVSSEEDIPPSPSQSSPEPKSDRPEESKQEQELGQSRKPKQEEDSHVIAPRAASLPVSEKSLDLVMADQEALSKSVIQEDKASKSSLSSGAFPLMNEAGEIKISFNVKFDDLKFSEKDKLGTGAYGTVYKGIYKFNEVAIKKLHAERFSGEALAEFKQEASIMARMHSDYIVPLRGICLESPHFCMVMELMPRGSLYHLLQNSPELPLSVLYRIALDIGYGLYHLHEAGILHRDLKSLNVLLDDRLRAKLTDFGLSKVKSEVETLSSKKAMKGTLGWMAPELFEEKASAMQAADIYAYGMILWELMIRPYRTPFKGLAPAALMRAKLSRGEKQETLPEKCPPKYSELIQWCWQTPKKRPSAKQASERLYSFWEESTKKLAEPTSILDLLPGALAPSPIDFSRVGPDSGVPLHITSRLAGS